MFVERLYWCVYKAWLSSPFLAPFLRLLCACKNSGAGNTFCDTSHFTSTNSARLDLAPGCFVLKPHQFLTIVHKHNDSHVLGLPCLLATRESSRSMSLCWSNHIDTTLHSYEISFLNLTVHQFNQEIWQLSVSSLQASSSTMSKRRAPFLASFLELILISWLSRD